MEPTSPQVPLFYSLPSGEDQLVEWWTLFLLPILMNVLVLLNRFLLSKVSHDNVYVRTLFTYANYAIIALTVYVFVRIILLVT